MNFSYSLQAAKTGFECQSCDFKATDRFHMKAHEVRHQRNLKFKCPRCNYSSNSKPSVTRHLINHHREEKSLGISKKTSHSKVFLPFHVVWVIFKNNIFFVVRFLRTASLNVMNVCTQLTRTTRWIGTYLLIREKENINALAAPSRLIPRAASIVTEIDTIHKKKSWQITRRTGKWSKRGRFNLEWKMQRKRSYIEFLIYCCWNLIEFSRLFLDRSKCH